MYALVATIILMTGEYVPVNTTYYNTEYTCKKVVQIAEDHIALNPKVKEYRFRCLKVPEVIYET